MAHVKWEAMQYRYQILQNINIDKDNWQEHYTTYLYFCYTLGIQLLHRLGRNKENHGTHTGKEDSEVNDKHYNNIDNAATNLHNYFKTIA